jgi:endonuclease/exonuclease/phosphatase family metal-dependent hydrolase
MRVLSYNIHKGFTALNRNFVLKAIKDAIRLVRADIVFLQEVCGHNSRHAKKHRDWPQSSQFEFLADEVWTHYAYGKNAVYSEGHHGNAILSQYPVHSWENVNISTNAFEKRGMLHSVMRVEHSKKELHCICLHLGLLEGGRQLQLTRIAHRVESVVPKDMPLIVAGDFNDWRGKASEALSREAHLKEAHLEKFGEHARTFPSWMPLLRLDRIHYRGMELSDVQVLRGEPWNKLSDHAAMLAEFKGVFD